MGEKGSWEKTKEGKVPEMGLPKGPLRTSRQTIAFTASPWKHWSFLAHTQVSFGSDVLRKQRKKDKSYIWVCWGANKGL